MDVPGVKEDAITITEHDLDLTVDAVRKNRSGEAVAKFQRRFRLDKKSVNRTPEIAATLAHGVLTITVAKKPAAEEVAIVPMPTDPPTEATDVPSFQYHLEVPGVKLADMKITVKGDQLSIEYERKRVPSSAFSKVYRSFVLDDDKMNIANIAAYLSDGILTFVIPKKAQDEHAASKRTILISHESNIKPRTKTDSDNTDNLVETVVEEDEDEEEGEIEVTASVVTEPATNTQTEKDFSTDVATETNDIAQKEDDSQAKVDANMTTENEWEDYQILN